MGLIVGGGLMMFAFADGFSDRKYFLEWENQYQYGDCLNFWYRKDGDKSTRYAVELFCIPSIERLGQ